MNTSNCQSFQDKGKVSGLGNAEIVNFDFPGFAYQKEFKMHDEQDNSMYKHIYIIKEVNLRRKKQVTNKYMKRYSIFPLGKETKLIPPCLRIQKKKLSAPMIRIIISLRNLSINFYPYFGEKFGNIFKDEDAHSL